MQQILSSASSAAISQARLLNKHWRHVFDRSVQVLASTGATQTHQLLTLSSLFPKVSCLKLGHVQNTSINISVLSALSQLSHLQLLALPPQILLPPWFSALSNLTCKLDITLSDTSLESEVTRLVSSQQNIAHLLLSYPNELATGLNSFHHFANLQRLNIQAGILHTCPRQGHSLLSVILLDFPIEPIPTSSFSILNSLTQLTSLRLIGVSGELDAEAAAQLSCLQRLQHLAIYVECSTGIAQLATLTSLTYLCLKSQALHITDDTVDALVELQNLQSLVLEGSVRTRRQDGSMHTLCNRLYGLARLPQLATLQFWGWLNAEAVDHLSALTSLTRLTLWESEGLNAETIRSIATLRHLEYLDLSYHNLADSEWSPIRALTALTALHLHGCPEMTDATVRCLSTLTNLQWLDISHGVRKRDFYVDHLTEEGIRMVGALTSLHDLNLTDLTCLTDHAVLGLSGLSGLSDPIDSNMFSWCTSVFAPCSKLWPACHEELAVFRFI